MAVTDLSGLPDNLPVPTDDGACDHLVGLELPDVELAVASGGIRSLRDIATTFLVLYVYPRTGGPGIALPDEWDMIPGARGCTPQSCAFRDHHARFKALDATVWGLSAQPLSEQEGFAERMHIPFLLLNDSARTLAAPPLRLPTFSAGGMTLYRRLTIVARAARIEKVFYPVFPPDENASDVITYLTKATEPRSAT